MQKSNVYAAKGEFFKILATTDRTQVGVMTLKHGEDSGPEEVHAGDQILYVIEGEVRVVLNGEEGTLKAGEVLIIPAGAQHHLYNDLPTQAGGPTDLFFLTIYAPPEY